jgi:hypothetical protein
MLTNRLKQFLCLAILISSSYAGAMKRIQEVDIKREHCKINMYNLITSALKDNSAPKALTWVEVDTLFAVNYENFAAYYQTKGNSTACVDSIKNRLTFSKSGFFAPAQSKHNIPIGYDKIYTYKTWRAQQSTTMPPQAINATTQSYQNPNQEVAPAQQPNDDPLYLAYQCKQKQKNHLKTILFGEFLAVKLLDNTQPNPWETLHFNVDQFISDLAKEYPNKSNDKINIIGSVSAQTIFLGKISITLLLMALAIGIMVYAMTIQLKLLYNKVNKQIAVIFPT